MKKTQRSKARSNPQDSSGARRWKRGLLVVAPVAVVAIAATFVPGAMSGRESGPRLTHTITRGDLVVSVTEQGMLESSNSKEIKCKVRGYSTVIWVIEGGTEVKAGDELVRLDTKRIEDVISQQTTSFHTATATLEQSKADVARAELAISEYLEGRYPSELMTLEKDLAIAQSNLRTAQNMLAHARKMAERGYVSDLEIQEKAFAVTQSELNVDVKKTEIDVLRNFAKAMELETLNGTLNASKAKHEADKERAKSLEVQLGLCRADLEYGVVKAEKSGMVIYPTGKPWEHVPKIEEGATVYMGQTMLLMPDLSRMQVKIGIPEAIVDRVRPGLAARVTLPDRTLDGKVSSVASVTGPAGWWNGNVVKYDTIITLPSVPGLKPGMSAEVELIIDRHEDVLTIPIAAVVRTAQGAFCWVRTVEGAKRRSLLLGDTNDVFTVVEAGLKEGDQVVLNPFAFEEAQTDALKPLDEAKPQNPDSTASGTKSKSPRNSDKQKSKPQGGKPKQVDPQSKPT